MPTFQYSNPELIHWGAGSVREKLDGELRRVGGRRVFVVTTKSAVREPALAPAVDPRAITACRGERRRAGRRGG